MLLNPDRLLAQVAQFVRASPKLNSGNLPQYHPQFLDSGLPELNELAPLPKGRISEISGTSGSGKSTIGLQLAAKVQGEGKVAILFDSDRKFSPQRAAQLGCDPTTLLVCRINNLKQVLGLVQELVAVQTTGLVVIDSTENLTAPPHAPLLRDREELLAEGLAQITAVLNKANSQAIVLFTSPMDGRKTLYGNPLKPKTPIALAHAADTRICLKRLMTNCDGRGLTIDAELIKSAHAAPMRRAELTLDFEYGFQP